MGDGANSQIIRPAHTLGRLVRWPGLTGFRGPFAFYRVLPHARNSVLRFERGERCLALTLIRPECEREKPRGGSCA